MFDTIIPFLTLDIPKAQNRPIGFLELINKQYHENINSAVYAYFINCDEKLVNDLFINSLTEIISEKSGKEFSFGKAFATCEVKTEKGRLDIAIEDQMGPNKIIIENKIFHWLHNDLLDYWNHYKILAKDKVGVLLTPYPHEVPAEVKDIFINITHAEWIAKVKSTGLPFGLSTKNTVYITDFINTIESLSTNYSMNEQAKFYFQHAPKILQVQETIGAGRQYLVDQYQLIAEKLGWELYGNTVEWRNIWDAKNSLDTYLTVITTDLLAGKRKISLVLELSKEYRNRFKEVEDLLKDNEKYSKMYRGVAQSWYIQLGVRDYTLTEDDLENFAEFVLTKIKEDFSDPLLRTIRYFYPDLDISAWEGNFY